MKTALKGIIVKLGWQGAGAGESQKSILLTHWLAKAFETEIMCLLFRSILNSGSDSRTAAERVHDENTKSRQAYHQVAIRKCSPLPDWISTRWVNLFQASSHHDASTSLYRFNATNGITCILMQVDGLIGIRYRNKLNEDVEADLYLPDYPKLSGECVESNLEIMTMEFKGFTLTMTFKKVCGRADN